MLSEKMARQLAFVIAPDRDHEQMASALLLAARRLEAAGIRIRIERAPPSGAALPADHADSASLH